MDQEGEGPGSLGSTRHSNSEGAGACAHPRYLATATSPGEGAPPRRLQVSARSALPQVPRRAGLQPAEWGGALGRVRSRSPGGLEA